MNKRLARNIVLVAAIVALFALIFLVITIFAKDARVDDLNYLLVGIDDAGENTDVMAIVSIKDNKLSILQIPRDTYFNSGSYQNKINQCYSRYKARSKSEKVALGELVGVISRQLGVKLDGFIGVKTKAFSEIIDNVGGITAELERDITVNINGKAHLYKKGINTLNGEETLALVRHRSSYKGGDLERLEVQRSVYRSIINTIFNKCTNRELISLVSKISKSLLVDIPLNEAFALLSRRATIDYNKTTFNMLSGVAIKDKNGVWYYALKRRENEILLNRLYGVEPYLFDKDRLFLNTKNNNFIDIYNS